ncbi:MAG: LVIVD repeat-containing protein [Xanthobacteraceae bacterium]
MMYERKTLRRFLTGAALAGVGLAILAAPAITQTRPQAPKIGDPPEAKNMRLVGHNDLQARSAYQPTIVKQGGRYIAYVGHHGGSKRVPKPHNPLSGQDELNGTSVVDVTDPRNPKYIAHIPGAVGDGEAGASQMTRVCSGRQLGKGDPNRFYLLRTFGREGHETWDVTEPTKPRVLWRHLGMTDTHKNYWECEGGIAYLVSRPKGFRSRVTEVFDLSDPAKPVFIRHFGLPGQQPGATGAIPVTVHGMVSIGAKGNRVYFAYGTNRGGIVQIVDREKLLKGPKEATAENFRYPVIGELAMSPLVGAHTAMPLGRHQIAEFAKDADKGNRDFVMVVNETFRSECGEARQMVWFVDATIEAKPMVVSHWTVKEADGNFCTRGGRFGAHSSNEDMGPPYYGKLTFITYFNAGVRVLDIRNPFEPKEVAYFIPPITEATTRRCTTVDGKQHCSNATIHSNNAETDDRGYIYVADRSNTGLHILELTGEPRGIAGLPPVK